MRFDHFDGVPDYGRLARDIGRRVAATRPPNVLAHNGRAFWKLTDADSGALAWLAFTRPDARSALARRTVWTLIPDLQVFMANWFVSVDHELTEQSQWIHTNIDVDQARELALLVPQPTARDMKRITRPEAVLTLDDIDRHTVSTALGKRTAQAMMTRPNKQEFWEWAYDDLLANTTRGVLAEYIVAKALGTLDTKRVEWDQYDLRVGDTGVEVKSAAYVQSWEQTGPSAISFDISSKIGWDAVAKTYAAGPGRSAGVYVFCLLEGEDREHIDPLDVAQWTFYVLPTSVLNREVPVQKRIRLEPLKALVEHPWTYDELNGAIHQAAENNRYRTEPGHSPAACRSDPSTQEPFPPGLE